MDLRRSVKNDIMTGEKFESGLLDKDLNKKTKRSYEPVYQG
jgi:hypothetical protein